MSEFTFRNMGVPDGGVCAEIDPEAFYPERGQAGNKAKKVCIEMCDVTEECLEGALKRDEKFGVWGGLNEAERRRLLGKKAI